jgi:hypothetical protein
LKTRHPQLLQLPQNLHLYLHRHGHARSYYPLNLCHLKMRFRWPQNFLPLLEPLEKGCLVLVSLSRVRCCSVQQVQANLRPAS